MAYKVFISHSTHDQGLVINLAKLLQGLGLEVSVAEWYLSPGERLDAKIRRQIKASDCFIVLLTRHGMRSPWVQQEIGIALEANKVIIPIVERGTDPQALGALQEREYIEYDPLFPGQALVSVMKYVNSLKLKKEAQEKFLLIAAGILAFFVLLSGGEK
jgi:hypothetical protein